LRFHLTVELMGDPTSLLRKMHLSRLDPTSLRVSGFRVPSPDSRVPDFTSHGFSSSGSRIPSPGFYGLRVTSHELRVLRFTVYGFYGFPGSESRFPSPGFHESRVFEFRIPNPEFRVLGIRFGFLGYFVV
jgi:hypothetical protein